MLGSVLYHAIEFIGIEQAFTPPSPNLPAARIGGTLSSPSLTPFLQMISFCFRNCCRWCSTSKKLGKLSYSSCVSLIDQSSSAIMIAQRVSEELIYIINVMKKKNPMVDNTNSAVQS